MYMFCSNVTCFGCYIFSHQTVKCLHVIASITCPNLVVDAEEVHVQDSKSKFSHFYAELWHIPWENQVPIN